MKKLFVIIAIACAVALFSSCKEIVKSVSIIEEDEMSTNMQSNYFVQMTVKTKVDEENKKLMAIPLTKKDAKNEFTSFIKKCKSEVEAMDLSNTGDTWVILKLKYYYDDQYIATEKLDIEPKK